MADASSAGVPLTPAMAESLGRLPDCALSSYIRLVLTGEEVACEKLKMTCRILVRWLLDEGGPWHFDIAAAERPVKFIETFCCYPSGKLGQPFKLELYEKAWIQAIFGFVDDDGFRRVHEVLIDVARKNGKTSLISGIEAYMAVADREGAPQVYNAANSLDQARLGYDAFKRIVAQSPQLKRLFHNSTDRIKVSGNMGYVKPLPAKPKSLDGFDVHLGILDEIHAATDGAVWELLRQGTAARNQPLIVMITTNGFVRNGFFDDRYGYAVRWLNGEVADDNFLCFIYELDDRDEWDREECWKKSNPGLGTVKKLSYLREQVARAKQDPVYRPTVMTKDFNLPENASVAWLRFDEAVNPAPLDMEMVRHGYGICGFDASDTIDLTAAQMLVMRPGDERLYERSMYWLPEDVLSESLEAGMHSDRDGAPYAQWVARGLMRTVPGNKIDKLVIVDWLKELRDEEDLWTYAVFFDPWHVDDHTRRELELLVGKARVFPVRQGVQTLSQPMYQLKSDYGRHRIVDGGNPVNGFCRMNVQVKLDVNRNLQPDKRGNDSRNRIDGFMAELMAYIGACNLADELVNINS